MRKQGISLISLVITIVVIIIIAMITIFNGFTTPENANFSVFTQEVDEIRVTLRNDKS